MATSAVPMAADRERGAEGSTGSRDCVLARGSGVKSNVAGEIDKQQEREPRDAGSSEGRSRQGARAGRSGRATRERERRCVVAAEEGERGATQQRRRSTEGKREQEGEASAPSLSSSLVPSLLVRRSNPSPPRSLDLAATPLLLLLCCCCCSASRATQLLGSSLASLLLPPCSRLVGCQERRRLRTMSTPPPAKLVKLKVDRSPPTPAVSRPAVTRARWCLIAYSLTRLLIHLRAAVCRVNGRARVPVVA